MPPEATGHSSIRWVDSHCHLDAPEFDSDRAAARERALQAGVTLCVLPAVAASNFDTVRNMAHQFGDAYGLGIHPLCTPDATDADIATLARLLDEHAGDERLCAIGEIGLDYFMPELDADKQEHIFREQLKLARRHDLPVILHVRRSVDRVLKALREVAGGKHADYRWHGIAHAFNGSEQQAQAFIDLGLKLGFGGAVTHERSLQLRRLAVDLPLSAIVTETDSPDIQPAWLYVTAERREKGEAQARNEPAELPRIGDTIAALRGMTPEAFAEATVANVCEALPRLKALLQR